MPHGNTLSRMLIAGLAAALIAAPAAMAQPSEPVTTSAPAQTKEPAIDNARGEFAQSQADAVSPSSKTAAEAAIAAGQPEPKPVPGLPTWPLHPRVLTPPASTTAVADDGDGGGVDAPIVALIIAGALGLAGAATVAMHRHRAPVAH